MDGLSKGVAGTDRGYVERGPIGVSRSSPSYRVRNLYSGTARLSGAGPWRMRPEVSYTEPWQGQSQPSYLPSCPSGTQPRCVQTPTTISHSGFCTRCASVCGSRSSLSWTFCASSISFLRAVTDEDRAAAPLDGDDLALGNRADVDLDRGHGEGRGVRVHLVDERPGDGGDADRADRAGGEVEEVSAVRCLSVVVAAVNSNPQEVLATCAPNHGFCASVRGFRARRRSPNARALRCQRRRPAQRAGRRSARLFASILVRCP